MRKKSLPLLLFTTALLVSLFSCFSNSKVDENSFDKKLSKLNTKQSTKLYSNYIKRGRQKLKSKSKDTEAFLADSILPFWLGTKWDFNGTTMTPQKGKIACGYFITNTLSSIGHPLKRIWYAQQASSVLVRRVCKTKTVKTFWGNNMNGLRSYMNKGGNGLYIIGLDNHVGYIYKDNKGTYFIHSCNWPHGKVIKEHLFKSYTIKSSNIHMIGKVDLNK